MKKDITEEKIMNEVYNFIVDEKITDTERKIFINFKNSSNNLNYLKIRIITCNKLLLFLVLI